MTEKRRPAAFKLDDPDVAISEPGARNNRASVQIVPDAEPVSLPAMVDPVAAPRRGFRWGTLFWSALGGLISLAAGLAVTQLIEDLFARSDVFGWLGLVLAVLALLAFVVIVTREAIGLARLNAIENFHARAAAAIAADDRPAAERIVRDLLKFAQSSPRLARARATLEGHMGDIIDGADLLRLAERELMAPLDEDARRLISSAAQRVSIITAASPRAAIDMLFVFGSCLRLIRQLARLYGGRPGALGLFRLIRLSIAHLAVTGGMAIGDSFVQQVVGHGIAAKLSAKLGEGVLNGLLTARLGLATVDVCRPLPFSALPKPALGDIARGLLRRQEEAEE